MANDRMFLRCSCGDLFALAKHFVNPWVVYGEAKGQSLDERLEKWLEEHQLCDEGRYPGYPTVVYESDDDFQYPPEPSGTSQPVDRGSTTS